MTNKKITVTPEVFENLARHVATSDCWDAWDYGWDAAKEEDIQHFLPKARQKAQRYVNILAEEESA